MQLFRRAMMDGLFRKQAVSGSQAVEATLHALTTGAAIVTFYCWLADLRWACGPAGSSKLAVWEVHMPVLYAWCRGCCVCWVRSSSRGSCQCALRCPYLPLAAVM